MENKLEQLLNNLLKAWWKPFNRNKTLHITYYDKCKWMNYKWIHLDGWFMNEESRTLRELVSIDSGLWQFVCEKWYNKYKKEYWRWYTKYNTKAEYWDEWDYEYYLIESSLKDENELEDFLLQNIKVGW